MRPINWYSPSGHLKGQLQGISCSLDLSITDVPKATLQILPGVQPAIHDLVDIIDPRGENHRMRVVSYSASYGQSCTLQLIGAVDSLSDDVYAQSAEEAQTKTATEWMDLILAQQSSAYWVRGTCELDASVVIQPNYQDLWTLLEMIREARPGYYWVYDYTVFPFRLSLRALPAGIQAGFTLSRNVESAQISVSDQEMCNRLIFTVTGSDGTSTVQVYNDAASQAVFGIRARCTDIKAEEIPPGLTAEQYAQQVLQAHSVPAIALQINGLDLQKLTGDAYDRITLGGICRAQLPDWGQPIDERVVSFSWPDVLDDSAVARIRVSMSTEIPHITGSLASARDMAQSVKTSARRGGGGGGKADANGWAKVLTKTIDAVDGTGIEQMWRSGITIGADAGVRIFSISQGMESLNTSIQSNAGAISLEAQRATGAEEALSGRIDVQAGRISLVVTGEGANAQVNAGAIILAINGGGGGSSTRISSDHIELDGDAVVTSLYGKDVSVNEMDVGASFSYQTEDVAWCTFSIDGTEVATFLGTADVDFDRAAAEAEGAAAMGIILDSVTHTVKVGASDTKSGTVTVFVGTPVYSEGTATIAVVASALIGSTTMAGQTATKSFPLAVSAFPWAKGADGGYWLTCCVQADGTDLNTTKVSISGAEPYAKGVEAGRGDATATYNEGWNDCRDEVASHTAYAVPGVSPWSRTPQTLYNASGTPVIVDRYIYTSNAYSTSKLYYTTLPDTKP